MTQLHWLADDNMVPHALIVLDGEHRAKDERHVVHILLLNFQVYQIEYGVTIAVGNNQA